MGSEIINWRLCSLCQRESDEELVDPSKHILQSKESSEIIAGILNSYWPGDLDFHHHKKYSFPSQK